MPSWPRCLPSCGMCSATNVVGVLPQRRAKKSPAQHIPTILDIHGYNSWSMKSFHAVSAGNMHECSLKSTIGRVRIVLRTGLNALELGLDAPVLLLLDVASCRAAARLPGWPGRPEQPTLDGWVVRSWTSLCPPDRRCTISPQCSNPGAVARLMSYLGRARLGFFTPHLQ
jgi:hypothetical protein